MDCRVRVFVRRDGEQVQGVKAWFLCLVLWGGQGLGHSLEINLKEGAQKAQEIVEERSREKEETQEIVEEKVQEKEETQEVVEEKVQEKEETQEVVEKAVREKVVLQASEESFVGHGVPSQSKQEGAETQKKRKRKSGEKKSLKKEKMGLAKKGLLTGALAIYGLVGMDQAYDQLYRDGVQSAVGASLCQAQAATSGPLGEICGREDWFTPLDDPLTQILYHPFEYAVEGMAHPFQAGRACGASFYECLDSLCDPEASSLTQLLKSKITRLRGGASARAQSLENWLGKNKEAFMNWAHGKISWSKGHWENLSGRLGGWKNKPQEPLEEADLNKKGLSLPQKSQRSSQSQDWRQLFERKKTPKSG